MPIVNLLMATFIDGHFGQSLIIARHSAAFKTYIIYYMAFYRKILTTTNTEKSQLIYFFDIGL